MNCRLLKLNDDYVMKYLTSGTIRTWSSSDVILTSSRVSDQSASSVFAVRQQGKRLRFLRLSFTSFAFSVEFPAKRIMYHRYSMLEQVG